MTSSVRVGTPVMVQSLLSMLIPAGKFALATVHVLMAEPELVKLMRRPVSATPMP